MSCTRRAAIVELSKQNEAGLESYKGLKAQMAEHVKRQAELQRSAQAGKVTEAMCEELATVTARIKLHRALLAEQKGGGGGGGEQQQQAAAQRPTPRARAARRDSNSSSGSWPATPAARAGGRSASPAAGRSPLSATSTTSRASPTYTGRGPLPIVPRLDISSATGRPPAEESLPAAVEADADRLQPVVEHSRERSFDGGANSPGWDGASSPGGSILSSMLEPEPAAEPAAAEPTHNPADRGASDALGDEVRRLRQLLDHGRPTRGDPAPLEALEAMLHPQGGGPEQDVQRLKDLQGRHLQARLQQRHAGEIGRPGAAAAAAAIATALVEPDRQPATAPPAPEPPPPAPEKVAVREPERPPLGAGLDGAVPRGGGGSPMVWAALGAVAAAGCSLAVVATMPEATVAVHEWFARHVQLAA